jgi:hypothetical protein
MSDAQPPKVPAPGAAAPTSAEPDEPGAPDGSASLRSWLIAGAVALLVVGGIGFVVSRGDGETDAGTAAVAGTTDEAGAGAGAAAGRGGFGGGAFGTLLSVDGATLTVESADLEGSTSEVTIETDDETQFLETVDGELADLAVGDDVVVAADGDAETSEGGEVEATSVTVGGGVAGSGMPGGAAGELPEGFEPPADGELPEGFEPPADGELPEGAGPGMGGALTVGTITSVDDASFSVETEDGESVTVLVGDDTTISVTEEVTIDDLAEGDELQAQGEQDDDGVVAADVVRIGGFGGGFPGGPGGQPGAGAGAGAGADAGDGEEL